MQPLQESARIMAANPAAGNDQAAIPDTHCSVGQGVPVLIRTSTFNLVGFIHDISARALSILVKQALAPGSAVSVEFGAVIREGTVISCRRSAGEYESWISFPSENKFDLRTAERFPMTEEVQIWSGGSDLHLKAAITDLSTHGIGLEMSTPLETGETIMVETASNEIFGTVRHCRRLQDDSFHSGVEIFHVMPKEAGDPRRY